MDLSIPNLQKWFSDNRDEILKDFFTFLRFKSISTDPAFDKETKKCATWLAEYLKKFGVDVALWETSGQPVLFGQKKCTSKNRPTLLIYLHYDVQPVDPIELWESDPFEPTIRNGNIFARGASDNKGQGFYTITALKAALDFSKDLNFNLKLFIEGEEESGSGGTEEVFSKKVDQLQADYLLIVDSGIPSLDKPAITLGLRGILTLEIDCRTSDIDMHSGLLGGIAYNPNRALATALAKLWDEKGKVAIPHFYDQVMELSNEDKKVFDLQLDEEKMKKNFNLRAFCPEPGYSVSHSAMIRPTVEINGMNGGYTGEGFKTVIPAIAHAKISCRLVPNQDPKQIVTNLEMHIKKNMPQGLEVKVHPGQGVKAFRSNPNSMIAKLTRHAYEEVLNKSCKNILIGASIPITTELARVSGAETVLMGYALDTDQIHAPNEHFGVDRFEKGFLTMGRIFQKINES